MTFTRSQSGIRNSALFFGVDRTVYVEGTGADQKFWHAVFAVFYTGALRFHFKSVGPRSAVIPYAEKIASGNAPNVIAIIDSDYEGLMSSRLNIPNIIYSFGYSFENDLFTIKQAIRLASQLSNGIGNNRFRGVVQRLRVAADELSKLAVLDFVAQFNGSYFFPKNGNTCRLDIRNNALGVICKKSVAAARSDAISRGLVLRSRPSRAMRDRLVSHPKYLWVYGHLWRAVFVKCVADDLRKGSSVNLNPDALENLAISNIRDSNGNIFTKRQISEYHAMFGRLR